MFDANSVKIVFLVWMLNLNVCKAKTVVLYKNMERKHFWGIPVGTVTL